jgi:hypothetical protein
MSYFELCRERGALVFPEDGKMAGSFIAPAGFVGEEAVVLPRPEALPVIEEVPARPGAWLMAAETMRETATIPPPSRRA